MSSTEAVMDIYTSSAGAIDGAPRAHLRFAQTNAALVYLSVSVAFRNSADADHRSHRVDHFAVFRIVCDERQAMTRPPAGTAGSAARFLSSGRRSETLTRTQTGDSKSLA